PTSPPFPTRRSSDLLIIERDERVPRLVVAHLALGGVQVGLDDVDLSFDEGLSLSRLLRANRPRALEVDVDERVRGERCLLGGGSLDDDLDDVRAPARLHLHAAKEARGRRALASDREGED